MSKKCPHIVQIDADTHKILKILSANLNMTMGQVVKGMAIGLLAIEKENKEYQNSMMLRTYKKTGGIEK